MNHPYDYATSTSDFQNRPPFLTYPPQASMPVSYDRRHQPRETYANMNGSLGSPAILATSTLFLGDLSVNCDEESLFELFCPFGEIETVQLKKSERDPQRTHLGFGFIKFTTRDAAERALNALNGYYFLGRALRVGWAEDYDKRNHQRLKTGKTSNTYFPRTMDPKKNRQTGQIHVTFISREMNRRISEVELGDVFSRFGNLVDIAIKKNAMNPDMRTQSGYAFVHFSLTDEGVRSAVTAVEQTNNRTYDHISFQSKVTHSLQAHIFSMKYRGAGSAPPPIPPTSERGINYTYHPRPPLPTPSTYVESSFAPSAHYLGEDSLTSTGYTIHPTHSTYNTNTTHHFDSYGQYSSYSSTTSPSNNSVLLSSQTLLPSIITMNDEYSFMKGNYSPPNSSRSPSHNSNSTATDHLNRMTTAVNVTTNSSNNNNSIFAMDSTTATATATVYPFYETMEAGRSNSFTTGSNQSIGEKEEGGAFIHTLTQTSL